MEELELVELILGYLPETLEGWAGIGLVICAILSIALPAPAEDAHPLVHAGHKIIRILGLGAGRLRTSGKLGKLVNIIRRKP